MRMNAREGVQDESVFKHDAFTRQPVEIGRAHLVAAIGAQVHPTQVIGEDENDVRRYSRVWSRFLPRRRASAKHKREQCRQREQAYLGIVRNSVSTQGPGWEQVKTLYSCLKDKDIFVLVTLVERTGQPTFGIRHKPMPEADRIEMITINSINYSLLGR